MADVDGFVSYMDRNEPVRLSAALGVGDLELHGADVRRRRQRRRRGGDDRRRRRQRRLRRVRRRVPLARPGPVRPLRAGRADAPGDRRSSRSPRRTGCSRRPRRRPCRRCASCTTTASPRTPWPRSRWRRYAHAQRNPRAIRYGTPLTREEYHASRWIAEPFHLYDCCPENDGAAAIVVTTAERARDLRRAAGGDRRRRPRPRAPRRRRRVRRGQLPDRPPPPRRADAVGSAPASAPADVQVAQFYENFTGPVLMAIAEMGFCAPGGAQRLRRRRRHPVARRAAADQHQRRQPRRGVHPRLRQRRRGGAPGARRVDVPGRRRRAEPVGVGTRLRAGQRRAVREG